ncbi:hypothetical protein [Rhizobium leguminosarum]|uniref:hypothetical protein n=1 Tax=Rhizobium leguminosarum TaxID=384 RepID=UPI0015BC1485|nr:hypothetical protein [Rhizobium leguminosarum]
MREDKGGPGTANFARIIETVPTLHFLSMSVFAGGDYDPLFILEANFDGSAGVFWGQIEATLGDDLREIVCCCKRPRNGDGELYDAVTAFDRSSAVASYFEKRTQKPSVFHHGNRGMSRARILREHELFLAVRRELETSDHTGLDRYRVLEPEKIHLALREQVAKQHAWLNDEPVERIPAGEKLRDLLKLLLYSIILIFVLSIPGFVLALLLTWKSYLTFVVIAAALLVFAIFLIRKPLPGTEIKTDFKMLTMLRQQGLLIAGYVVAATALLVPIVILGSYVLSAFGLREAIGFNEAFRVLAPAVLLGLLSLFVTLPLIVLWLRFLELRDSSHDAPHVNERVFREMVRREDWVAQNHMGSIVHLRPGVLRTIIARVGHLGLGLLLRVKATNGYLGSMRTVHFAHWAFLNNGSRLLFFSNFDHSWDSYLDDFIEKAHAGLTLAWGCGVGFPPTRFLVYDGASHGRKFKNWALASRTVSRFWYSAYPTLTVDQIERNYRIADGLHKKTLSGTEVSKWIRDL